MATVLTGKDDSGTAAWAQLPVGIYPATLVNVEDKGPSQFDPDKNRLMLTWELQDETDEEGNSIQMYQFMNMVLSPRSTLASVIETLGYSWAIGEPFDVDQMIGAKARLMTGRKERTRNGQTEEIAEIVTVVALEQPKPRAAAPVRKAAPATVPPSTPNSEGIIECDVAGCHDAITKYTRGGKGLCDKHDAEDL